MKVFAVERNFCRFAQRKIVTVRAYGNLLSSPSPYFFAQFTHSILEKSSVKVLAQLSQRKAFTVKLYWECDREKS